MQLPKQALIAVSVGAAAGVLVLYLALPPLFRWIDRHISGASAPTAETRWVSMPPTSLTAEELMANYERYKGQRVRVRGAFGATVQRQAGYVHISCDKGKVSGTASLEDAPDFMAGGAMVVEGVVVGQTPLGVGLARCKRILP